MALARPPLFASGLDSFPTTAELPRLPAMSYTSKQDRVSLEWLTTLPTCRCDGLTVAHVQPGATLMMCSLPAYRIPSYLSLIISVHRLHVTSAGTRKPGKLENLHYVVVC